MLSEKTFKKMSDLSRKMNRGEEDNNKEALQNNNYLNLLADISTNYSLVRVNNPDSNNYHFELRKVR
ncbi:MAG: hypothetical protein NTZ83_04400 [Candidatus Pacearchaeota archaeon]|nr:hypothetical protein [Candidatus Pacearchaeota archaeon]